MARDALTKIADARQSEKLKSWLQTGVLAEFEMSASQAYIRLNIEDRSIEDELILNAYKMAVLDTPSQVEDLSKALGVIATDRNSPLLLGTVGARRSAKNADHKLCDWPVGLDNIGNTCYLNSLLQFYFSIKPVRDIVLNFDDYKMLIEPEALDAKKVGSRKVTKGEVKRAQQCKYIFLPVRLG